MARSIPTNTESGSLKGHFLVAMPNMLDPNFARSVTYVCEHNEDGAMGLVVNALIDISMGDIYEQMQLEYSPDIADQTVLCGGPVQQERGFVLHRQGPKYESTMDITPEIALTASKDIIVDLALNKGPDDNLVVLGYAGWGGGQLEKEIAENSWLTVPADANILFETPLEHRWNAVMQQYGIDINLMSGDAGHA